MTAYIALGSNLPGHAGSPSAMLLWAVAELRRHGLEVARLSPFYRTAPVPAADQPDYVNAVCSVARHPPAPELLDLLHAIERDAGRLRTVPNAPRPIDLDLLAVDDLVTPLVPTKPYQMIVPHPRLHERAFVLLPLRDVAPGWRHPVLGLDVDALIAALPPGQRIAPLDDDSAASLG